MARPGFAAQSVHTSRAQMARAEYPCIGSMVSRSPGRPSSSVTSSLAAVRPHIYARASAAQSLAIDAARRRSSSVLPGRVTRLSIRTAGADASSRDRPRLNAYCSGVQPCLPPSGSAPASSRASISAASAHAQHAWARAVAPPRSARASSSDLRRGVRQRAKDRNGRAGARLAARDRQRAAAVGIALPNVVVKLDLGDGGRLLLRHRLLRLLLLRHRRVGRLPQVACEELLLRAIEQGAYEASVATVGGVHQSGHATRVGLVDGRFVCCEATQRGRHGKRLRSAALGRTSSPRAACTDG